MPDNKENIKRKHEDLKYNYEDLVSDLKEYKLPARWCYIKVPDQLIFYYFSETYTTITVIVKPGMTQLIQVLDCTICEPVLWNNFDDFLCNLKSRQNARVCNGIYPLNQKRSKNCCTIYFDEQHPVECIRQCDNCEFSQVATGRCMKAIQYQRKRLRCSKVGIKNLKLSLELIEDKFNVLRTNFERLFS